MVQKARHDGLQLSYQVFKETDLFYDVYNRDKKEEFKKPKKNYFSSLPNSIRNTDDFNTQKQSINDIIQARMDHKQNHQKLTKQSKKKFLKKLLDFLLFLSRHKITISNLQNGLLSTKPHSLKASMKLFTLVKTNQLQRVNNMVLLNRFLLFQIDNVSPSKNLNKQTGKTPAHWACMRNYFYMLRVIIRSNGDFEREDHSKLTPLEYALKKGSIECIRLLFINRINPAHCIPKKRLDKYCKESPEIEILVRASRLVNYPICFNILV